MWPKKVYNVLNFIGRLSDMVINRTRSFSKKEKQQKFGDEITTCVVCDHENKIKRKETTENERKNTRSSGLICVFFFRSLNEFDSFSFFLFVD